MIKDIFQTNKKLKPGQIAFLKAVVAIPGAKQAFGRIPNEEDYAVSKEAIDIIVEQEGFKVNNA